MRIGQRPRVPLRTGPAVIQHFGTVAGRRPHGTGYAGRMGTYVVRDSETGEDCTLARA